jgi:D-sedoheptulose 7-phosphate isomerase
VLRAVEAARELGMNCIGLLGKDGGSIAPLCDAALIVPSDTTARIQEAHIFIGHALCALVERELGVA